MKRIAIYIFLILLVAATAWGGMIIQKFSSSAVTYSYAGFPNADGEPNAVQGNIVDYSAIDEGSIVWQWTATESGTINAIRMGFKSTSFASGDEGYYTVYVNDTLVATAQMADSWMNGGWDDFRTVTVESGESLSFSTNDVIEFGVSWTVGSSSTAIKMDDGNPTNFYYDVYTWGGYPASTINTSQSSNKGLFSILRYEK